MATSVNNIAATFATIAISSSSSLPPQPPPSSPSLSTTTSMKPTSTLALPPTPNPISASWNPQTALLRSQKSSLLSLYGPPGPRPLPPHFAAVTLHRKAMISVGDRLPNATLSYVDRSDCLSTVSLPDLARHKKLVVFAVLGAFAPAPRAWVAGFVKSAEEMKARGADAVACVAVNDVHVMKAWGEKLGAGERVAMLSDGGGEMARAMGLAVDLSGTHEGLGVRSRRYSLVAVNGVVKAFFLEQGDADDILRLL